MNSLCLDASKNFMTTQPFLGFRIRKFLPSHLNSLFCFSDRNFSHLSVSCSFHGNKGGSKGGKNQRKNSSSSSSGEKVKVKEKENVWSVDNELASKVEKMAEKKNKFSRKKKKSGKRVGQKDKNSRVMISGTMLNEVETVLQTQEPVIKPAWNTFSSSVSGIWKGVGAVFSPITAEMEPIELGKRNEYDYDCYTLSHIELVPSSSEGPSPQIIRKINWVTLNPYGEIEQTGGSDRSKDTGDRERSFPMKRIVDASIKSRDLPTFESFDFRSSELLEEDIMGMEPGLVFFEDGSYSRGPVDIPVGEFDESEYFHSPTFKFEQCLVKGCHKRLRIMHTIEFGSGGSDIQIMRVAVYEEQWVSPANLPDLSDKEFDLKPFSQRKRIQPSELTGSWKVFEMSATPIYDDETNEKTDTPYVYLSTETLKKRRLPENSIYFGEEELQDMQDASVLWLPGGVTGYVDISKDGVLCIGVGWYSDEGINLVMEREYGLDGKLKDVRCKSEMKRRWSEDSDALSV